MYQGLSEEDLLGLLFQGLKLNPTRDFLIINFRGTDYKIAAEANGDTFVFKATPVDVKISAHAEIITRIK